MSVQTAVEFAHDILRRCIRPGDTAFDATVGNGYDTAFLLDCVGAEGLVIGCDIQPEAIEATTALLHAHPNKERVRLYCQSHDNVGVILRQSGVQSLRAAVYNLGYRPRGDKAIITQTETTITSLVECLSYIEPGGSIVVVAYRGHSGASEEADAVQAFASALDKQLYSSAQYRILGRENPPECTVIMRKDR